MQENIFPSPSLNIDGQQMTLLYPGQTALGVSVVVADEQQRERLKQALIRAWNSSLLAFQRESWNVFTSGQRGGNDR